MPNQTLELNWEKIRHQLLLQYRDTGKVETVIPLMQEIDALRREKNAVILAHYYQIAPVQLIADHRGDSLALAMKACQLSGGGLVVSCTVHFMAEMVKLLSPAKKVVLPSLEASCSIAEGINGAMIRRIRKALPEAAIVAYINTTAEAKAEVDAVCTSANAKEILQRAPGASVVLVPDYYFSVNIIRSLPSGRKYLAYREIRDGEMILENPLDGTKTAIPLTAAENPRLSKGVCVVHEEFTPRDVEYFRRSQQVDLVLAHPEVKPEVARLADMVGGTGKIIDYVGKTEARTILFITECDLAAPLLEAYPDRNFITPCKLCPYMKKITLEALRESLQREIFEVEVPPEVAAGARRSLDRMFEWTRPAG